MLRRILFILILVCMLVSLAGCGSMQAKVTSNDDGKQLNARVGEKIVITLDGNPSTGYTWEPKELDASMIQQVGSTEFKSGSPGLVGAGGTLILTFKVLKPGTTTLTLIYHRPWETDVKPLHSFTTTIIVK
jgi:inhibitor of cysteine peptidase